MQVDNHAITSLTASPAKLSPPQTFGALTKSSPTAPVTDEIKPDPSDPIKTPSPPDLELPEVTLDGIKKAWGSDNATFDLNADGIVNIGDLLQFLAEQEPPAGDETGVPPVLTQPATPSPPVLSSPNDNVPAADTDPSTPQIAAPAPETTPPADITVDGFNDAWGSDNTDYDLNGDGTVNVSDLLQFLSQDQANVSDNTNNTEITPGDVSTPALTVDGFQKTWGTSDTTYDIDGNGTVNIADLLQFLGEQQNGQAELPPAVQQLLASLQAKVESGSLPDVTNNDLLSAVSRADASDLSAARARITRTQDLSGQLIDRFERAGFTDHPPANVRTIADSLGLDDLSHQLLMKSLQSRYPDGLGLSVLG